MKNILPVLSLALIISCQKNEHQQNKDIPTGNASQQRKIRNDSAAASKSLSDAEGIKKEYAQLNSLLEFKKLDSSAFSYSCNDEITGDVVFYYEKGALRSVKHFYAKHSHFSSSEQYFIHNNQVFFIFQQDASWNFDGGTPEHPITKDDITEKRIYLNGNTPLLCLEKQYSIRSEGSRNPDPNSVSNKEVPCNIEDLMSTYQSIMRHEKEKKEIGCL